jgi:hypothetical protein
MKYGPAYNVRVHVTSTCNVHSSEVTDMSAIDNEASNYMESYQLFSCPKTPSFAPL